MMTNKLNPWNWFKNEDSMQSRAGGAMQAFGQPQRMGRNLSSVMPMSPMAFFTPLTSFYQDIDKMFEQTFRSLGLPAFANENIIPGMMFRPNVDVTSSENEYMINVEVPGIDENDVRIELAPDNTLIIRGEKRQESREEGRDFQSMECNYGVFQRILSLPEDADKEGIEANFNNGVLRITVPRTAAERSQQTRQINVSTGGGRQQGRQREREQQGPRERESAEARVAPKKAA
jgi:HSP20 family protein